MNLTYAPLVVKGALTTHPHSSVFVSMKLKRRLRGKLSVKNNYIEIHSYFLISSLSILSESRTFKVGLQRSGIADI